MLNKPPLNVSWKWRLCHRCQFLMSLTPSGAFSLRGGSLLIQSQPPQFCDGNKDSSRWGETAPFSVNIPSRRPGRHHLEGEGQIIKGRDRINCQDPMGWECVEGRGGQSSGRRGDGGADTSTHRAPGGQVGSDRSPEPLPAEARVCVTVSALKAGPDSAASPSYSPPGALSKGGGHPNVRGRPRAGGLSQRSSVLQVLCRLPPGAVFWAPGPAFGSPPSVPLCRWGQRL